MFNKGLCDLVARVSLDPYSDHINWAENVWHMEDCGPSCTHWLKAILEECNNAAFRLGGDSYLSARKGNFQAVEDTIKKWQLREPRT